MDLEAISDAKGLGVLTRCEVAGREVIGMNWQEPGQGRLSRNQAINVSRFEKKN